MNETLFLRLAWANLFSVFKYPIDISRSRIVIRTRFDELLHSTATAVIEVTGVFGYAIACFDVESTEVIACIPLKIPAFSFLDDIAVHIVFIVMSDEC